MRYSSFLFVYYAERVATNRTSLIGTFILFSLYSIFYRSLIGHIKSKRKKEKCKVIIRTNEYTFDLVKEMVDQGFQEKIYVTDYNLSAEVEKQYISIGAEILDYNSFHPEDTTYENRTINKIVLAAPMEN